MITLLAIIILLIELLSILGFMAMGLIAIYLVYDENNPITVKPWMRHTVTVSLTFIALDTALDVLRRFYV
jgi:hypothetical protein